MAGRVSTIPAAHAASTMKVHPLRMACPPRAGGASERDGRERVRRPWYRVPGALKSEAAAGRISRRARGDPVPRGELAMAPADDFAESDPRPMPAEFQYLLIVAALFALLLLAGLPGQEP